MVLMKRQMFLAGPMAVTLAVGMASLAAASPIASPTPRQIEQWATSATASSQYGDDDWSAEQATGAPDSHDYGDESTAWAPANKDGTTEWLSLDYAQAVMPTGLHVVESDAPGFVRRIEAWDEATSAWSTLWQGSDPTPAGAIGDFSPPLTAVDWPTRRIRVTIDTTVPDWNEIDAVALVGNATAQSGVSSPGAEASSTASVSASASALAGSTFGADVVVLDDSFDQPMWGVAQDQQSTIAYRDGQLAITVEPTNASRWTWRALDQDAPVTMVSGTVTITEGGGASGLMCGGSPRSSDFLFGLASPEGTWYVGDIANSAVNLLAHGTLPGGAVEPGTPVAMAVECAELDTGRNRVGCGLTEPSSATRATHRGSARSARPVSTPRARTCARWQRLTMSASPKAIPTRVQTSASIRRSP
jgi:hypothetical protein